MESDAKYVLVGALTLLVFTGLVFCLLWLAGASPVDEEASYTIAFREQSLKGLQIGGPVSLRGVKVGSVSSIKIDDSDPQIVKVVVLMPSDLVLREGISAVISRSLLTGLAAIDLVGLNHEAPALPRGGDIPEGRTDLQELASNIPEFLNQVSEIVKGVDKFLSKENAENFSKTLENLQLLSATLSDKRSDITELIENLNAASKSVSNTAKNIEDVSTDATQAIGNISSSLEEALVEVSEMLSEVQEEAREIASMISSGTQLVTESAVNIGSGAKEVSESLSNTLQSYEEPREIIFGIDDDARGPGE